MFALVLLSLWRGIILTKECAWNVQGRLVDWGWMRTGDRWRGRWTWHRKIRHLCYQRDRTDDVHIFDKKSRFFFYISGGSRYHPCGPQWRKEMKSPSRALGIRDAHHPKPGLTHVRHASASPIRMQTRVNFHRAALEHPTGPMGLCTPATLQSQDRHSPHVHFRYVECQSQWTSVRQNQGFP